MSDPRSLRVVLRLAAVICAVAAGALATDGHSPWTGAALVTGLLLAALSVRGTGFTFTLAIFAGVTAAMFYPEQFVAWRGYKLTNLIVPLIQIIMFGMGTTLSVADFARVLKVPRGIAIGMALQFGVMPVTGYTLARMFGLQGEVAAGVILVGAAPGGVASNVITYLAGGNVPLSVTMTACSTLLSPILTPFAMTQLAGQYVPISFVAMMWSIVQMIVVPVAAGLIVNRVFMARMGWLTRGLPVLSMAAICTIIVVITASSRDRLLTIALTLIVVVILHNAVGYLLGYLAARGLGMNESDARTTSIEVGLQNAGMASGLAIGVLHSSDAGLAAAVFGPWMNISGSLLASFWRRRPVGASVALAMDGSGGSNETNGATTTR